jgi:tellurite resistance protein
MFGKLMGLGKTLMADADKALGRITSKPTLVRVCQASYLIAAADDNFSDAEKEMLQKVVQRKLPGFKMAEIAGAIDAAVDELAFSKVAGKRNLLANIEEAAGTDQADIIMLAVLAVANADNEFADVEKAVAREICMKLRLPLREYEL